MEALRFAKMSGAGNDFIVLDQRSGGDIPRPEEIRRWCQRGLSVGADGVLLLLAATGADFAMRYFNADGSEAGMCGNGGRCIARFAVAVGAGREGQELTFTTPSGRYRARVQGFQVRLELPAPKGLELDLRLSLAGGERSADFIDTGVPHVVLFTDRVAAEDVPGQGREIRNHPRFRPAGVNVNFCQVVDAHRLHVRTYERGVEGETLACGTGSAAAALLAARRGWVQPPVTVVTRGGAELLMDFRWDGREFSGLAQSGEARLIYWGELTPEAAAFEPPR